MPQKLIFPDFITLKDIFVKDDQTSTFNEYDHIGYELVLILTQLQ
jgi:hypothetical protein